MWTRKSQFVIVHIRVKRVHIPLVFPLSIFWELMDAVDDLALLFGGLARRHVNVRGIVDTVSDIAWSMSAYGRLDIVDVDAVDKKDGGRVRIKIGLR